MITGELGDDLLSRLTDTYQSDINLIDAGPAAVTS